MKSGVVYFKSSEAI